MKEGYESDVFDPEMSLTPAEDKKKENAASDEEYNTKNNTNDSDEDFNISKYVNFSVDSNEPSIRYIKEYHENMLSMISEEKYIFTLYTYTLSIIVVTICILHLVM